MKRFLISSPAFTGDAEIFYDETGRLVRIDVMNTNITPAVMQLFKAKVPTAEPELEQAFAGSKAIIVQAEFEISLEDFKREYPYQRNMHLLPALWAKMDKTAQVTSYYAAVEYRKYCERNKNWYNPKIAAAWLKNKEYINDWKKM
jgi:hypothetical protein